MPWILQGGHDLIPTSHSYVLVKHWSSSELLLLPWELICLESLLLRTRYCQQWAPKAIQVRARPLGVPAVTPKHSFCMNTPSCWNGHPGPFRFLLCLKLCVKVENATAVTNIYKEVLVFQVFFSFFFFVPKFGFLIVASVKVGIFCVIKQMFNLLNPCWWALMIWSVPPRNGHGSAGAFVDI